MVQRYQSFAITINNEASPIGATSFSVSAAGGASMSIVPASARFEATIETSIPLRLVDPGDLAGLAWMACATPSTDASEAFLVLVDALLERGLIHEPEQDPIPDDISVPYASTQVAAKPLLVQAWDWLSEAVAMSWLDRLTEELTHLRSVEIPLATGSVLDRIAGFYGLERRPAIPASFNVELVGAETDAELRERCRLILANGLG